MRTHTTRHTQEDLNQLAKYRAHKFQAETLERMFELGWKVQSMKSYEGTTVVTVSHSHGGFGMIAPNGMFSRPIKGKKKVEWSWDKMADLAQATIPCIIFPTSTR